MEVLHPIVIKQKQIDWLIEEIDILDRFFD